MSVDEKLTNSAGAALSARPGGSANAPAADSRVVIVSAPIGEGPMKEALGSEAYSYYFVYRGYKAILECWGKVVEVGRPESQVNFAFRKAQQRGAKACHLAFFPAHLIYISPNGPTAGVVAWEFSTIPDCAFGNNLRNNWVQVLNQLQMVITLCEFSRQVLMACGVRTPVVVIPPPVAPRNFSARAWNGGTTTEIDSPAFVLSRWESGPSTSGTDGAAGAVEAPPARTGRQGLRRAYARGKRIYYAFCHDWMPPVLNRATLRLVHRVKDRAKDAAPEIVGATPVTKLQLRGVVYTTVLSVFDGRKNWTDILTAFLKAFGDTPDATLVIKLVVPANLREQSLQGVAGFYQSLGIPHRCRVVLVATYLTNDQMMQLMEATTFYVNASRAEGLCMPLQDYLAAGRPAVAPRHTAMLDYFDQTMGFVVNSSAEPTHWPHDPRGYFTTSWQRIDWQSLHDQLKASYDLVRARPEAYREMAAAARARMLAYAGAETVEPRMRQALEALAETARRNAADVAAR